ncbi:MAG: trypsin-like peptidase domain-containing protein [bacterium]|nr:trypsin-like peptidase domain-containing protein [bacterium]
MSELSGSQFKQLQGALVHAFSISELKRFVRFELDETLENIAVGNREQIAFELVNWADREGKLQALINALPSARRNNPKVRAFLARFDASPQKDVSHQELQKMVSPYDIQPSRKWRNTMEAHERRVCRIEIDGEPRGTGFLVASDIIMTCQHVVAVVETGTVKPAKVVCRFDYRLQVDEPVPESGRTSILGDGWLIESSPPDPIDEKPLPKEYEPDTAHLDYALLRLADRVGDDALGTGARGFVPLSAEVPELEIDGAVGILQHPKGSTLGYAHSSPSITEVNEEETRVRHRTNTKSGSSGSPCFDFDWNLIALHHSGDPETIKPSFNEGIPIKTIRDNLAPQGKQALNW